MNAPFFTIIAFSPLFGSTTILDPAGGSPHMLTTVLLYVYFLTYTESHCQQ
jgi:hypothetical protein